MRNRPLAFALLLAALVLIVLPLLAMPARAATLTVTPNSTDCTAALGHACTNCSATLDDGLKVQMVADGTANFGGASCQVGGVDLSGDSSLSILVPQFQGPDFIPFSVEFDEITGGVLQSACTVDNLDVDTNAGAPQTITVSMGNLTCNVNLAHQRITNVTQVSIGYYGSPGVTTRVRTASITVQ